jgi:hypothetical protein
LALEAPAKEDPDVRVCTVEQHNYLTAAETIESPVGTFFEMFCLMLIPAM